MTLFGSQCSYVVGREFSVVVYVTPKTTDFSFNVEDLQHIKEKGLVDEVDVVNGKLRLWWD
jgi:hypothetical protein